ncbi:MAG TPA: ABC transporter ATP-binding protein [Gemmatimonadales bacterium]|nr:ABC transporter ATP-binding protein [Gemmatimonadales bacterium]
MTAASAARPSPAEAVLSVRELTKTYRAGEVDVRALRGVDLDITSGELVVILGPSGSGKSTLLNILGGLETATTGSVFYRNQNLTRASEKQLTEYRRESVAFVFQFYNLIPSLTALENVALVTDIASNPMKPDEALDRVGLSDRIHHFPSQLSGGQQQRVAIARAIARRPDLLLCDEPTGALDVETGVLVMEVIERLNSELGTTTLIITHNAAMAGLGDRVLRLADGLVVSDEHNEQRVPPHDIRW